MSFKKLSVFVDALKSEETGNFSGKSRDEIIEYFAKKGCTLNVAGDEMWATEENRGTKHRWNFEFDEYGNVNDVSNFGSGMY